MAFTAKTCYYFDRPGPANTGDAAHFAIERAKELGITTIIVASGSGETAQVFSDAMNGTGISLIVVTHVMGFAQPGEWEFSEPVAQKLRSQGVKIVTGTHVLSGLERALSRSPRLEVRPGPKRSLKHSAGNRGRSQSCRRVCSYCCRPGSNRD